VRFFLSAFKVRTDQLADPNFNKNLF